MSRKNTSSTPALVVALLALIVAITGTAVAASSSPAPLTKGKVHKIANHLITTRARTLTVLNAKRLGHKPAKVYPIAPDWAATSTFRPSCDPASGLFVNCLTLPIRLHQPAKIVLMAETPFGDDTQNGATGICRILLDNTLLPATVIRPGIGGATGGSSDNDNTGMGISNVTGPVSAGTHVLTLQCSETTADIDFNDLSMSAVAIPLPG